MPLEDIDTKFDNLGSDLGEIREVVIRGDVISSTLPPL